MADHDKTEAPTAKRKREARQQGQVAKSQDLYKGQHLDRLAGGLVGWLEIRYHWDYYGGREEPGRADLRIRRASMIEAWSVPLILFFRFALLFYIILK